MHVSQVPSAAGGASLVGSQTFFLLGVNRLPISESRTRRGAGVVSPKKLLPAFAGPWTMMETPRCSLLTAGLRDSHDFLDQVNALCSVVIEWIFRLKQIAQSILETGPVIGQVTHVDERAHPRTCHRRVRIGDSEEVLPVVQALVEPVDLGGDLP